MLRVLSIVLQADIPRPALIIANTMREAIALEPSDSGKYNVPSSESQISSTSQMGQFNFNFKHRPRVATSLTQTTPRQVLH